MTTAHWLLVGGFACIGVQVLGLVTRRFGLAEVAYPVALGCFAGAVLVSLMGG